LVGALLTSWNWALVKLVLFFSRKINIGIYEDNIYESYITHSNFGKDLGVFI
jgi:hypothetical protein